MAGAQAVIVKSAIDAKFYSINPIDSLAKQLNGSGIVEFPMVNQPSSQLTAVINGTRTMCLVIAETNLTTAVSASLSEVDMVYAKGTSMTFAYHGPSTLQGGSNAGIILGTPASDGVRFSLSFFAVLAVLAALVW